ncbi:ribonuclease R [Bartonella sp. AR 15-3]|uniref:ribonuclease R n=1 Tax=Bartonella sp. AR 15-3 TaxID=545617 RepID=UPI0001F4BF9C|nr:ribonuclease R [Bartonella sp. AR 15-3]OPB31623.1 RNAse R [Bartonella sp. AR 15-3]CBI79354.1 Exoribonuclease, VacB and RNase II family [Bartonella sp. AR 15-3]
MAKSEKKKYFQSSNIKQLPSKSEILSFITNNPSQSSKQKVAKAFNLNSTSHMWLKDILRDLKDNYAIPQKRKNLIIKKALPSITLAKVSAFDKDGNFIAEPLEWPNDTKPNIFVSSSYRIKGVSISIGDHVLIKIFRKTVLQNFSYTGRIIRKIDKKKRNMLGIARKLENGEWRLDPIERKNNELIIDMATNIDIKVGNLIEAEIKDSTNYSFKQAKVRNILGHIDNEKDLSMIALISKEIPYIFPSDVLEEAENVEPDNTINREDWRQLSFITIDPADAKDHDDAVYAIKDESPTNSGGWIIVVAIADVSCYIKAGSILDQEALKRGNSVYFPDRVVPMLPERISNDRCSLHEGKDRPALAVRMIFDANGNKRKHSFHRIVMRTAAKLSYQEVQCAIEGNTNKKTAPLLENILQPLWDAYSCLKIARNRRQPLALEIPEKKIILDQNGYIKDVVVLSHLEAHHLIEEFMIQANVAAAETLKEYHQPLIYRIHDKPSLAKQEMLQNFLKSLGISLARGTELTSAQLNNILIKVMNTQQQELVNQVILRLQSQAEYNPENIGHFGLNLLNYTHFTSPIRRYADLIIHRALIKALQLGNDALTDEQEQNLAKIANQISLYERRAMIAERETVDRLVAHYLANKIGNSFAARISGVTKAGLFIALDKLNADGFVPLSTLKSDYYYFDEVQHALIGKHSHKCYQLGDAVEVKILEVQPFSGALCFEMLTKPRLITFSPISYHKNKSIAKKRNYIFYKRR